MITEAFPKLNDARAVQLLRAFFRSACYPALVVFLMVCAELFAIELAVYWIYLFLGVLAFLFEEDTLALVPIACCCYMCIAGVNNPGKRDGTMFEDPATMAQFVIIAAFFAVGAIGRLVGKLILNPVRRAPSLSIGYLALGAAYLLGGVFTEYYSLRTVFFGFVQIVSVAFFYFYFYYTVDWKRVKKDYIMLTFFCIAVGIAVETVGMYFNPWVDLSGDVKRGLLYTGWGIYNNVGGVLVMASPAAFYLALTKKYGWLFSIAGCLLLIAVFLTQSRSSILFGGVMFAVCAVTLLVKSKGRARLRHFIVFAAFACAIAICMIVSGERLLEIFASLEEVGTNPNSRLDIYKKCWETFTQHPFFGVGFYETPGGVLVDGQFLVLKPSSPDNFLPPRAHNTLFQLIATGGAFALAAYLLHRVQTLVLFFRRPSPEKLFIFFCVCGLLLTSLLDCHFFNFGPGILYAVLLAFAEGEHASDGKKLKKAAGLA